jgi:hypothetical protein
MVRIEPQHPVHVLHPISWKSILILYYCILIFHLVHTNFQRRTRLGGGCRPVVRQTAELMNGLGQTELQMLKYWMDDLKEGYTGNNREIRYVCYGVTPIQTSGVHSQAITDCPSVKVGWKQDKALKCSVFNVSPEAGQGTPYNDQATEWTIRISTTSRGKRVFSLLLIVQTDSRAHPDYYSMRTGDRVAGAWNWPLTIQRRG